MGRFFEKQGRKMRKNSSLIKREELAVVFECLLVNL